MANFNEGIFGNMKEVVAKYLGKKLGKWPNLAWLLPWYHHGNTKYHHSIMKEPRKIEAKAGI